MKKINKDIISAYLHFGYLPQEPKDVDSKPWANFDIETRSDMREETEEKLIKKGTKAFKKALNDCLKEYENDLNIIPLSGGWDSRAILAGLIDLELKDEIVTVTFGTPGTLDYQIGKKVAKKLEITHKSIDLRNVKIEQKYLEKTALKNRKWSDLIDIFYNDLIYHEFGENVTYWSGFMGDPLSGAHLPGKISKTWEEALSRFVKSNQYSKSSDLTHPDFDPKKILPKSPFLEKDLLTYDDQLDFGIRQEYYIKPIVIKEDYDCVTPFLSQYWLDFILNLPHYYRKNQYLYKKILLRAFPDLFSLPTKSTSIISQKWLRYPTGYFLKFKYLGSKLFPKIFINPGLNYIDFNKALREKQNFKKLVYTNISNLKDREITDWFDPEEIWNKHQGKKGNYAKPLITLSNLEVYLRVENST